MFKAKVYLPINYTDDPLEKVEKFHQLPDVGSTVWIGTVESDSIMSKVKKIDTYINAPKTKKPIPYDIWLAKTTVSADELKQLEANGWSSK